MLKLFENVNYFYLQIIPVSFWHFYIISETTPTKPQISDDRHTGKENDRCGGECCNPGGLSLCWGRCDPPCGNGLKCLDSQGKYSLDARGNGIGQCKPGKKISVLKRRHGYNVYKLKMHNLTFILLDHTTAKPEIPEDRFTGKENDTCGGICCNKFCRGPCYDPCGLDLTCLDDQGNYSLDADGNGYGHCKPGKISLPYLRFE